MTKSIEDRIQETIAKHSGAMACVEFKQAIKKAHATIQATCDVELAQLNFAKGVASKNTSPGKDMPGDNNNNIATVAELHAAMLALPANSIDNTLVEKLELIIKNKHGDVAAIEIYKDSSGKEKFAIKYDLSQYLPKKK
jgi:hypothetical protein